MDKSVIMTKRTKALWTKHRPYFKPDKKKRLLDKARKMTKDELIKIHVKNYMEAKRIHETNKLIYQVIGEKYEEEGLK